MRKRYLTILCFCSLLMLNQSCMKEDLSKVTSHDTRWKAGISLPVSTLEITSAGYRGGIPLVDLYKMVGMVIVTEEVDFVLSDIFEESEYVESLMLRLNIANNFPSKLSIFAYYMDEYGRVIKSVVEGSTLDMDLPEIDAEGNITKPTELIHDETFNKENIPELMETKKILVRVFIREMDLSPEVLANIDDFSVDIKIGVRSAVDVPIDQL